MPSSGWTCESTSLFAAVRRDADDCRRCPSRLPSKIPADLLLFRMKDHCARPATEVSFAVQGRVVYADGRRCTWVYETTNETAPSADPGALFLRRGGPCRALPPPGTRYCPP